MEWTQLFTIALGAILVNNFIVAQFLGICPFMGVSKKIETASGMGLAVIFVMGLASAICWPINELILVPMGLTFMQTVTYILVIASLVQFIEMFLKKAMPSLYEALGVYLPLMVRISPASRNTNNMNQKLRPTAKRTRHRIYPALVDMTTLVRLTVPFFSMRAMSN